MRKHSVALVIAVSIGLTLGCAGLSQRCAPTQDSERHEIEYGIVKDIEGNEYRTVTIGTQEWMAENLKTTTYNDGEEIQNVTGRTEWNRIREGAYVWYGNDESAGEIFGALYNSYAVDTGRLCPEGWALPDDDDWDRMLDYLKREHEIENEDKPGGAGNALKSCRQIDSPLGGDCDTREQPRFNSNDTHYGTDLFGFAALPGGYRQSSGVFTGMGEGCLLWNKPGEGSPSRRWITSSQGHITRFERYPQIGASVRCIRE